MRIGLIQFPGSNCERETALAVKRVGMEPVDFLWNESPDKLEACAGFILVGGFSYQDRARAGMIAAFDPLMERLKQQSELGKPVLGICNGAQILVESGLIPGFEHYPLSMALTNNKRVQNDQVLGTGYYNVWTYLKANTARKAGAFTACFTSDPIMHVPLAHAQGRFVATSQTLQTLIDEQMIAFQYCDPKGQIIDAFPVNPNGSLYNLAAVCNPTGNVMAMMPHPERTPNGDRVFQSMRQYIDTHGFTKRKEIQSNPKASFVQWQAIPFYSKHSNAYSFLVEQVISDDEARSVERSLNTRGINASIKKYTHWEITSTSESQVYQAQACGALFNERKEFISKPKFNQTKQAVLLTQSKENLVGLQKIQQLKHHYAIEGIDNIKCGTVWVIETTDDSIALIAQQVLNLTILFNPLSYECFRYA